MPEDYPGMKMAQMQQMPPMQGTAVCAQKEAGLDRQVSRLNNICGALESRISELVAGLTIMDANRGPDVSQPSRAPGTIELELSAVVDRIEASVEKVSGLCCSLEPVIGRIKLLG